MILTKLIIFLTVIIGFSFAMPHIEKFFSQESLDPNKDQPDET